MNKNLLCTGNDEWYTPHHIIKKVKHCFNIELDPASSDAANRIVGAARYYTIADDGLSKEWGGNIFMNPPYSRGLCAKFTSRLVNEYYCGTIHNAIVLVNNSTDAVWFHKMAKYSNAICFTSGRLAFLDTNAIPKNSPVHGQAIFLFTSCDSVREKFFEAFDDVGMIVEHLQERLI